MFIIHANEKTKHGKGASRRLRANNKLPAIIYGKKMQPLSIEMNHDIIFITQKNEKFYTNIQTLIVNKIEIKVKIQAVQRHPYKQQLYHIDFIRI